MENHEKLDVIQSLIIPVIGWTTEMFNAELMAMDLVDLKNLALDIQGFSPYDATVKIFAALDNPNVEK